MNEAGKLPSTSKKSPTDRAYNINYEFNSWSLDVGCLVGPEEVMRMQIGYSIQFIM